MTTTWNPSDKTASCSLSGGNLIATATAGGGQGCRAINAISGKRYFEVVATNILSSYGWGLGVSLAGSAVFMGGDLDGIGYYNDNPVVFNGVNVGTPATYTDGDNIGVAIDDDADLVWFRKNGVSWYPSGDPALGTGGYDISTRNAGSLYPAVFIEENTNVATAKFATASWTYAAPSGFGEINPAAGPLLRSPVRPLLHNLLR